jgi:hypothetical protein
MSLLLHILTSGTGNLLDKSLACFYLLDKALFHFVAEVWQFFYFDHYWGRWKFY